MNKRIRYIIIGVSLTFAMFFTVGGYFINKYHHQNVRDHPIMYCYEYYRGTEKPVSVLIIEDLDLKEPYLNYYRELKSGNEPYLPNEIPLKGMPQYSPVYVMGYTEDSLLVDVISYYNRGAKFGGSYTRGWVYADCLHENPPPKKKENNVRPVETSRVRLLADGSL